MTDIDRAPFAAYCQAYGRWAQAEKSLIRMAAKDDINHALLTNTRNGMAIQNPMVGLANKAKADMMRHATEFGMTPSSRSRVNATPNDQKDEDSKEFFG